MSVDVTHPYNRVSITHRPRQVDLQVEPGAVVTLYRTGPNLSGTRCSISTYWSASSCLTPLRDRITIACSYLSAAATIRNGGSRYERPWPLQQHDLRRFFFRSLEPCFFEDGRNDCHLCSMPLCGFVSNAPRSPPHARQRFFPHSARPMTNV